MVRSISDYSQRTHWFILHIHAFQAIQMLRCLKITLEQPSISVLHQILLGLGRPVRGLERLESHRPLGSILRKYVLPGGTALEMRLALSS